MRKSAMPSQRGKVATAPTSRSGRAIADRGALCEDDDGNNEVLRREAICPLFSHNDLAAGMKGELRETHIHRDFKLPAQDPTKVQFFDPVSYTHLTLPTICSV